jgi:hypothetical protein
MFESFRAQRFGPPPLVSALPARACFITDNPRFRLHTPGSATARARVDFDAAQCVAAAFDHRATRAFARFVET